jgi:hypothetical protein
MFVGVVLAIALAGVGNHWERTVAMVVMVAVLTIAAAVTYWLYDLYSTEQLVAGYTDSLASALGVSPLLAQAATAVLVLPAVAVLAWAVSFSKVERRRGQSIIAAVAVVYLVVLWSATMDQRVSRQGEPLQGYVVTEQGLVWRDIRYRGTDPATG